MGPTSRAAFGWQWHTVPSETAAARERELGKGDVVIFTDEYTFPSVLWNERYSNRVVYVPFRNENEFFRSASELNAKWITAISGTREYEALHGRPNDWEEVGVMSITRSWMAFRRRWN